MADTPNTSVEERIVEMRFDNKQFEEGVKTTMSTLEKFKNALKFNNSEKGIEKIQNNLNSFNLTAAISGLDGFTSKLSGLEIFSKRIVENIADSVYSGIRKVEQGLNSVFKQIETGGERRAQNIEQAKFQLEGLGIAWEDIQADINEGVKDTAYGLDSAARIAAQLSASNVAIGDDMAHALRGISGVAAMTNSTYDDIGRIFTQVAGAGRLYTQDMLQISSRGLNVAAALGNQLDKTESEIREMVTRGQIDFKTFANAMNDAFGGQAKKANDTYSGSLSNVKAALSRIGADVAAARFSALRKVFVDLIPKIDGFKKAMKPVETILNDIISRAGETLQSIISKIDVEAIVKKISPMLIGIGNIILWLISQIDGLIEEFEKIKKKAAVVFEPGLTAAKQAEEAGKKMAEFLNKGKEPLKEVAELTDDVKNAFQAAQDIFDKGLFGNGQERVDALKAAGIDPELTQKIIDEYLANGRNWDEAVKKATESSKEVTTEQEKEEKKAIALNNVVKNLALTFYNLKRVASNVFESIGNILSVVSNTVKNSFSKGSSGEFVITTLSGKIADLSDTLLITKERAEIIRKPLSLIISVIRGLTKVVGTAVKAIGLFVIKVVSGIASIAKKIANSKTFKKTIDGISDALGHLKKTVGELGDKISKSDTLQTILSWLKTSGIYILDFFGGAVEEIIKLINDFLPKIADAGRAVVSFLKNIGDGISTAYSKIKGFFTGIFNGKGTKENLFADFSNWIKGLFSFLFENDDESIFGSILDKIKQFVKWISEKIKTIDFKVVWKLIKDSSILIGIYQAVRTLKAIKKTVGKLPNLLTSITDIFKAAKKVNTSQAILNISKSFTEFAKSVGILVGSVIALSLLISKGAKYEKAVNIAVNSVSKIMISLSVLVGVVTGMKALLAFTEKKNKFSLKMPLLIQLSSLLVSLSMVLKSVRQMSKMSKEDFEEGVERLNKLARILGLFALGIEAITAITTVILKKFDAEFDGIGQMALLILSFSGAMFVLSLAFGAFAGISKLVGTNAVENAVDAMKGLIWAMGMMLTLIIGVTEIVYELSNSSSQGGTALNVADVFKSIAWNFISIALSMNLLAVAIINMGIAFKLMPGSMGAVIGGTVAIFIALAALLALISKNASADANNAIKRIPLIILALTGLTYVLTELAETVTTWEQVGAIGATLLGMAVVLWSLSAVMESLSNKKIKLKNIDAAMIFVGSLSFLAVALSTLKGEDWAGYLAALGGLSLVVRAASKMVEVIGQEKPKKGPIMALGVAFAGLGAMMVPLIFLKHENWKSIASAAAPLVGAITPFIFLVREIGAQKVKAAPVFALGVAFTGLAVMLTPLIFLKQANLGAIRAGGVVLAAMLGIFTLLISVVSKSSLGGATLFAIGGGIALFSAGLGALGGALAYISNNVNPENFIAISIALGLFMAALGAAIAVLSKAPAAMVIILELIVAMAGIAAVVIAVTWAISKLLDKAPEAMSMLQEFVYTVGTLPGLLIAGLIESVRIAVIALKTAITGGIGEVVGTVKEELGINSPSTVFEEIGMYCVEGLANGILNTLAKVPKKIINALKEHVVDPVKDFFGIASPSKLFSEIGDFCAQGLENGLKEKLSGINLEDSLSGLTKGVSDKIDDFKSLGGDAGTEFINGLKGKLPSVDTDFSSLGESIGMDLSGGIVETTKETLKGINWAEIYSLNDLLDNENIYNDLKAAGETQLTAAYEAYKEHLEFIKKNPTFQAYVDNIKENFDAATADLYNNILNSGDKYRIDSLMSMLMSNYINDKQMPEEAKAYIQTWEKAVEQAAKEEDIANKTKIALQAYALGSTSDTKFNLETNVDGYLTMHVQTPDGKSIDQGIMNTLKADNGHILIDYDNSSLKPNIDTLKSNIVSVNNRNSEAMKLEIERLRSEQRANANNYQSKMTNINNAIESLRTAFNNIQVRMDTGAIVGQLVGPMDNALGRRAAYKERGG